MTRSTAEFPRQYARTRRFSLGRPRAFRVAPDGSRVLYLRSGGEADPVTDVWSFSTAEGTERRLTDAAALLAEGARDLPPAERARRERAREMSGGVVGYATDHDVTTAVFALHGRLFSVDVHSGDVVEHATGTAVFDPRPAPAGTRIAYVAGDGLYLAGDEEDPRPLAVEDGVRWGVAEFVAAEEMQRSRGYWWSPDGSRIAATRVDETPVATWHIADPAHPERPAQDHRYPAAGTANADVTLHLIRLDGGARTPVRWDREASPYLAQVIWKDGAPLTLLVQSRDQRRWQILIVDDDTGATTVVREDHDDAWLEIVPGTPTWSGERLVAVVPDPVRDANVLVVGDEVVSPRGVQVRTVVDASAEGVTFTASGEDPTQVHVWRWDARGGARCLTLGQPGVHAIAGNDEVQVRSAATLDGPTRVRVQRDDRVVGDIAVHAADPVVAPRPRLLELEAEGLRGALLLPSDDRGGDLPVLLDPYGGPHAQRVLQSRDAFAVPQWFADQGMAVLVVDGRGTPGRGPAWERAVRHDLATPVLDDQIRALAAAADLEPRLDLDRVAIRGWSFGGYLAALAVLRRPDVFRAGIAGAPVTDWRLYDTHYTERYLGHPDQQRDAYRVSSLVDPDGALLDAAPWDPDDPPALMIIHGLADDNVVAAHALRLSHALLADGRPHTFLPLTGVTHMTPQVVVAENLLRQQVWFLRAPLRLAGR